MSKKKKKKATDAKASASASKQRPAVRPPIPGSTSNSTSSLPTPKSVNTPEHTHVLSTKWLSSKQLNDLVETEGLLLKKGKFSKIEENAIREAIEKYRVEHNLTQDELTDLIFRKHKGGEASDGFWQEATLAVPQRGVTGVYHYVKRQYHPLGKQGKWSDDEDEALLHAVGDLGQAWEKVSEQVGRPASDCRDRYRNHLVHRDSRVVGKWSAEEEAELTRIVREQTLDKGKSADSDVFWSVVSEKMGNKRSRQQCRMKWTDSLNRVVKSDGCNPRWSQRDGLLLVQRVAALNVNHDSEIQWTKLNDDSWNIWSAHQLQRRWERLKRPVKGHEQMSLSELLEILKDKKNVPDDPNEIPPPPDADELRAKEDRREKRRQRKAHAAALPSVRDLLQDELVESEDNDD
ncbi:hypothetical protein EXIGLDRAFT_620771 [Exidia glandulosa HHB12029]|uniref:Uncharacterized protein n=1 Tax=Exidia glandulosa HHB12029 TaxID=1314781 RepID=A0A165ENV7_EXIGL|nr:hypothetical protein EXIGLDRAFT_620771 [Exidia glandulosa HHB12029]